MKYAPALYAVGGLMVLTSCINHYFLILNTVGIYGLALIGNIFDLK